MHEVIVMSLKMEHDLNDLKAKRKWLQDQMETNPLTNQQWIKNIAKFVDELIARMEVALARKQQKGVDIHVT